MSLAFYSSKWVTCTNASDRLYSSTDEELWCKKCDFSDVCVEYKREKLQLNPLRSICEIQEAGLGANTSVYMFAVCWLCINVGFKPRRAVRSLKTFL